MNTILSKKIVLKQKKILKEALQHLWYVSISHISIHFTKFQETRFQSSLVSDISSKKILSFERNRRLFDVGVKFNALSHATSEAVLSQACTEIRLQGKFYALRPYKGRILAKYTQTLWPRTLKHRRNIQGLPSAQSILFSKNSKRVPSNRMH